MSIGKNLKRLRLAADLNQTELAKRSGIDQSMISKIERGSSRTLLLTRCAASPRRSDAVLWSYCPRRISEE